MPQTMGHTIKYRLYAILNFLFVVYLFPFSVSMLLLFVVDSPAFMEMRDSIIRRGVSFKIVAKRPPGLFIAINDYLLC